MAAPKVHPLKDGRIAAPRIAWPRIAGCAAGWLVLVIWGALYRMPYDVRIGVALWSCAAGGVAGLALGIWKNGGSAWRARTGKGRWQHFRAVLGFAAAGASLIGVPVSGMLIGCNGTFRGTEAFIVDGTVVAKHANSGRGTSYLVTVRQGHAPRVIRFSLDREAFDRAQPGDHYHEEFQVGLFGWPCRPR